MAVVWLIVFFLCVGWLAFCFGWWFPRMDVRNKKAEAKAIAEIHNFFNPGRNEDA